MKSPALTHEDRQFLDDLDYSIWDRTPDRFGSIHSFEKRPLTAEEQVRVLRIIQEHELPCVLSSGPYGGLYMVVYDHAVVPYVEPEGIVVLGRRHFAALDKTTWMAQFEFFASFTHTARNRELCSFYKLPEPRYADYYAY